ncbi:hypothetical protein HDU76_001935 [Blyttiomyces sp. JEL0837]|nr:hypothetical protein HDU76_001935 [Blyttiomyces sp. JEL0837]
MCDTPKHINNINTGGNDSAGASSGASNIASLQHVTGLNASVFDASTLPNRAISSSSSSQTINVLDGDRVIEVERLPKISGNKGNWLEDGSPNSLDADTSPPILSKSQPGAIAVPTSLVQHDDVSGNDDGYREVAGDKCEKGKESAKADDIADDSVNAGDVEVGAVDASPAAVDDSINNDGGIGVNDGRNFNDESIVVVEDDKREEGEESNIRPGKYPTIGIPRLPVSGASAHSQDDGDDEEEDEVEETGAKKFSKMVERLGRKGAKKLLGSSIDVIEHVFESQGSLTEEEKDMYEKEGKLADFRVDALMKVINGRVSHPQQRPNHPPTTTEGNK